MKVSRIKDLLNTDRHVKGEGFDSIRVLLEMDNMGFSLHKTIIPKGGPYHWHYKHHLEACYCIKGSGELTNLDSNMKHGINVDSVYILDDHDNHTFEAYEDTVLISIFNPPVTGFEVHGKDGSYEPNKNYRVDRLTNEIVKICNNCKNDYDLKDEVKQILKSNI